MPSLNNQYVDPDYLYSDSRTGVLRNLVGATSMDELVVLECNMIIKRSWELLKKPIKVRGVNSLFEIHKYLFQDVYKWAGEKRTVEISKGGKQFFPTVFFDTALVYIDGLIADYKAVLKNDKKVLAGKLGCILDSVNELHPFREGNGRAQREFVRVLALEKGYKLDLNPADAKEVYNRYMLGTCNGDQGGLALLIEDQMVAVRGYGGFYGG